MRRIFFGFYHRWALWPSWSCDLDHLYKLLFPLPKEAPHKKFALLSKAVLVEKMFENGGHIQCIEPRGRDRRPLVSMFFVNSIIQSI